MYDNKFEEMFIRISNYHTSFKKLVTEMEKFLNKKYHNYFINHNFLLFALHCVLKIHFE